jgi:hypothetical protein
MTVVGDVGLERLGELCADDTGVEPPLPIVLGREEEEQRRGWQKHKHVFASVLEKEDSGGKASVS